MRTERFLPIAAVLPIEPAIPGSAKPLLPGHAADVGSAGIVAAPATGTPGANTGVSSLREQLRTHPEQLANLHHTQLDFHIDPDTKEVVVKVINRDSGAVIYQIPNDVALNITRQLVASGHGLLDRTA